MFIVVLRFLCYNGSVLVFVVRELADLHKANASRASEAEEAALSRDAQAKEKLSLALEKAQEEARIQQEALADQVRPVHSQNTDHVCKKKISAVQTEPLYCSV